MAQMLASCEYTRLSIATGILTSAARLSTANMYLAEGMFWKG